MTCHRRDSFRLGTFRKTPIETSLRCFHLYQFPIRLQFNSGSGEYTGLNDFISNYVRGALNIPVQVPLPFDAEFTSSMSIRVIRRPPAATEAEADCAES
jgi:hypothetical protein